MGEAQLIVRRDLVVVTGEQMIPLQRISLVIGKGELSMCSIFTVKAWIDTNTVSAHIQKDGETSKDKPEVKVGCQDVPLVVIVEASCWCCLSKKGWQRGNHERRRSWEQALLNQRSFRSSIILESQKLYWEKEVWEGHLQQQCRKVDASADSGSWAACRCVWSATCWRTPRRTSKELPTPGK